ncbi:Histidine phosphatase superfamily, clade-1 [Dillenia turbinata]|uniref:Histidine phosphatase superfamily, clade-1 n=1 Tax=Dillenia turbinata TaxID=194707 RepID=A0AAN8UY25_9MAGN
MVTILLLNLEILVLVWTMGLLSIPMDDGPLEHSNETSVTKTSSGVHLSLDKCLEPQIWRVSDVAECDGVAHFGSTEVDSTSSSSSYAEIVVIRHGETEWNADGRIQGHLDVDLNDVGRQQAAAVAARLSKEPKVSVVYSSDLKRALETAQTIATICGGLEVIPDPDLRERHLGDLQGLVHRELATACPKAYKAFLSNRTDQEIPGGGESLDQLYERCTSALQRIGDKHRGTNTSQKAFPSLKYGKGERVVVVTHGGVIKALYERASPRKRSAGKVLNTSVNTFHLYENEKWAIEAWGDVSHLRETGFLKTGFGGDRNSG